VTPASLPTPTRLFTEFARVGLSGFGGVLPFIRRAIVERNRWMDDREFTELLSIAQVMPGPNVVNLSVMLGYRYAGLRGALAGFTGLVLVPLLLLLALVACYYRFGDLPGIRGALRGMMAVSAGLIIATGLKLASSLPRRWRTYLPMAAALVAIGVLRLPLVPVVLALLAIALALEWQAGRER
jgi:chromate transporter